MHQQNQYPTLRVTNFESAKKLDRYSPRLDITPLYGAQIQEQLTTQFSPTSLTKLFSAKPDRRNFLHL